MWQHVLEGLVGSTCDLAIRTRQDRGKNLANALNSRILVDLRCLRFENSKQPCLAESYCGDSFQRSLENSVPLLRGKIAEKGLHIPLIYRLNSHH